MTARGRRTGRAVRWWALLTAALGLLVGCAGVPGESPVVPARRIEAPRVQLFAAPPVRGLSPTGVVSGFLRAGSDFHSDHQVARLYLDGGGTDWQALAPVVFVDQDSLQIELLTVGGRAAPSPSGSAGAVPLRPPDGQTARVRVSASVESRIDEQGRFTRSGPGAAPYRQVFELVGRGGEWRIRRAPQGLVLTPGSRSNAFSPVPLYFPDRTGSWLVPDVRWFPALEPSAIAATAVRALLAGPAGWLRGAVTSGAGRGTSLAPLAGVQLDAGVARVDLDRAPEQRALFQAQLLATLQALPLESGSTPVSSVEITVRQVKVDVPPGRVPAVWSSAVVESPPSQNRRDDAVPGRQPPLCLAARGQVGQIRVTEKGPSCAARDDVAALTRPGPALLPAGDQRDSVFAVLDAKRNAVLAMPPGGRQVSTVLRGKALTAPSIDGWGDPGNGWVWAASGVPGGPLLAGGLGRRSAPVAVPWLGAGTVKAVRVAPEGARALVVVQRGARTDVVVSGVVRDRRDGRPLALVADPLPVVPDLASAVDAVWLDPQQVAVLGARGTSRQLAVWSVQVGGDVDQLVPAAVPRQDAEGLAVSGNLVDVYVRERGGAIIVSSFGQWSAVPVRAATMRG